MQSDSKSVVDGLVVTVAFISRRILQGQQDELHSGGPLSLRLDRNPPCQGAVNRTFVSNLEQPLRLFRAQWPPEADFAVDVVDRSFVSLAVGAISRMFFGVAEPNCDVFKGPT